MFHRTPALVAIAAASLLHGACAASNPAADDGAGPEPQSSPLVTAFQPGCRGRLKVVHVAGTVFHFGLDLSRSPPVSFPFQSTVEGVRVSIAELPATKLLRLRSDASGNWGVDLLKEQGAPLHLSFVYEKAGYQTTKSQVFEIGDAGIDDVAIQLPTQAYYTAAKTQIEQQISGLLGVPYALSNVLVTTVGKSWASMYTAMLPHGDPGAQVAIAPAVAFPASLGPVYFNSAVVPDPALTSTSVDGGVLFGNLAPGTYTVTATKAPFTYTPLAFAVEPGIALYVASPPHATQGTNDAGPGLP